MNDQEIQEKNDVLSFERAREDAIDSAFKYVRKKLDKNSDLESFEMIQQAITTKHQNKIKFFKSRVQGCINNLEYGIKSLEKTKLELSGIKEDNKSIENNKQQLQKFTILKEFDLFKTFSSIWEQLQYIDEFYKKLIEAESYIEDVVKYYEKHPKGISIKCYQTIQSLLDFESDLIKNVDEQNVPVIISKFDPIHKAKAKLMVNVHPQIEYSFFTESNPKIERIIAKIPNKNLVNIKYDIHFNLMSTIQSNGNYLIIPYIYKDSINISFINF